MITTSALFAAVALFAAADEVTLKVDVDKAGTARWTDDACLLEARDANGAVLVSDQRGDSVEVVKGMAVTLVIACPAKEGTVRRSQRVVAKRDETIKLKLAPGAVVATIDKDGTKSAGTVVVYDANDVEVARGADRTALPVDAGKVRVVGLIDRGSKQPIRGEAHVVVKAEQKAELTVDASDGELVVDVTDNGKAAGAVIGLREPGSPNRVMELVAGTPTSVPSGTWDIVTQLENSHDFREQLTKGVVVTPKKLTKKTIGHSTGTLTPTTQPATGVLVELLHPGADVAFNQLEVGVPARLSPGRYVVRATGETALDDGAKPVVTVTHTVGGGSAAKLALQPAIANVDVEVRVGGEAAALPVSLRLPDGDAPFITKTTDAKGAATFAVAPQKLVVSTTLTTPHGPLEVTKPVTLNKGSNRIRLDFNVGSAVVQVVDAGTAVVADVAFYERLKNGQPTGEPIVALKGGEEARLPPGIYVLAVKRNGEQRLFGEVRIAAGRRFERSVDWSPAAPIEATTTTPTTTPAKK